MNENPYKAPPDCNEVVLWPPPRIGTLLLCAVLIFAGVVLGILAGAFLAGLLSADLELSEKIRSGERPSPLDPPDFWELNLRRVRWGEACGSILLLASLGIMGAGIWLFIRPQKVPSQPVGQTRYSSLSGKANLNL